MAENFQFKIEVELPKGAEKEFERAAEQALKQVGAELDGRFTDAISSAVWPWPFPASNGKGSPRSIVDTGALKQSGVYNLSGLKAEWKWTISYAAAVHEGARLWNGANIPARPWTNAVLEGGTSASVPVYDFTTELSKRITNILS